MKQILKNDWEKLNREERGKLIFQNGSVAEKCIIAMARIEHLAG